MTLTINSTNYKLPRLSQRNSTISYLTNQFTEILLTVMERRIDLKLTVSVPGRPARPIPGNPRHGSGRLTDQKRDPRLQREETDQNCGFEQRVSPAAHETAHLRNRQDLRHIPRHFPPHLPVGVHRTATPWNLLVLLSKKGEETGAVPLQREPTA